MTVKPQSNIINYIVICISDFAERFSMDTKSAYRFLLQYGGINFLLEHYEIEHILSIDEVIDDLEMICMRNGGVLQ